jgi:hypothetical protein
MITRRGLLVAVAMLLPPAQALAAPVCFQDQFGNLHTLEVVSQTSSFFLVAGNILFGAGFASATCGSAPVSGSANLTASGAADFGYTVYASGAQCFPLVVRGTLAAPGFSSGTGTFDEVNSGRFGELTFSPVACQEP